MRGASEPMYRVRVIRASGAVRTVRVASVLSLLRTYWQRGIQARLVDPETIKLDYGPTHHKAPQGPYAAPYGPHGPVADDRTD